MMDLESGNGIKEAVNTLKEDMRETKNAVTALKVDLAKVQISLDGLKVSHTTNSSRAFTIGMWILNLAVTTFLAVYIIAK